MQSKILIGLLLLINVFLTGCSNSKVAEPSKVENPLIISNIDVDNYFVKGKNEQYFSQVPQRVVVIGENETETLLELGVIDNIIMTPRQDVRECPMKEGNVSLFQKLPKFTNANINMEYLTKLKPDLIIAQQCYFTRNRLRSTEYWNDKGVRTLIPINTNSPEKHLHLETVEKEMQFIDDLGKVFNREARAQEMINNTYSTIEEINSKTKSLPKPKVMAIEILGSLVSYDRTKLVGNMIEHIGGQVAETSSVIGYESIIKANPDVLFVVCCHENFGECKHKITDNPALQNLPCVKNKKVYSIPLLYTYGASCRTEDGIKYLAQCIYPQVDFKFTKE